MEQNQNPQQPDMQDTQNYQYNDQGQQVNQANPYYQANTYNQGAVDQNQQFNQGNPYNAYGQGAANVNQQPYPYYQDYQKPVYSPVTVKKRLNPAVIIVPVAILAVAAIVVLLIILFGGKGGYKGAEEKFMSQMFGGLSSALSETEKISGEPQSVTVSLDAANSQISDYIGISNLTFVTETAVKGEDIYAHLSLDMGDMILNGNIWFDKEESKVLVLLPEISSIYLQANIVEDGFAQDKQIDVDKAAQALNDIVSDTMETYFEVVGDTEIQGGQTLVLEGESYTADKVEIKLDSAEFATVVKAFLESLRSNDDALEIIGAYCGMSKAEVLETLDDNFPIETLDEVIESGGEDSQVSFNMTVWMQGGNIVGREVLITDDDGYTYTEFNVYQIPVADGTVTYFEIPDEFKAVNNDKVSGELHSGTLTMSDGYDEITVKYYDMAVTDKLFQGEARIIVSGSEAFEITAELKSEGDAKTVIVSVPNVLNMSIVMEPSQLSFEDMPQPSGGEVAVLDSDGDFYEDEAYEQFMNDILEYLFGDLY